MESRECDEGHTQLTATESWRRECDGSLAQATYVAASLINKSAEELDSVRIWPLIEALASASDRVEEPRNLYVT